MKILYFGNPYIKEDSLAIKVAEKLIPLFPNLKFQYIKDTFQLMDLDFTDTLLLDVADNIQKVNIVDAKDIKSRALSSLHDFDLSFFLNMTGQKISIIVIPQDYDENTAFNDVREIITNIG